MKKRSLKNCIFLHISLFKNVREIRRSIVRSGEERIEIDSKKVFNRRDFPVIQNNEVFALRELIVQFTGFRKL